MASIARPLRQVACRAGPTSLAQRTLANNVPRIAAFHASSRRNLLPPLPQKIQGTVNDPAPVPSPSPSHGHYHWTFERILAAGLVPLTVAPFAAGSFNPVMDAVLCSTLLRHSHRGLQNVITDYLPQKRVPKSRKAAMWLLNLATAVVGVGLYEFETNDVGLTEGVRRIWTA
uniref:Succinate dehydrogenase [ubiquinone] cytochrome b small subunit n=1 Tax=Pyricularia grisea TaxID=148305 RepID=Q5G5B2_PYRGI|nr:succinate dehydrogenase membrane anchor subunit-like protein [Pyricularia grisea]